jgi:hypothetical protein
MILEAHDNLIPPEILEEVAEQETVEEDESSLNIFRHFSDSIFQANFETLHPYNTRSKTTNKPSSEITTTLPPKQSKSIETKHNSLNPSLDYDLVEDLKNIRANIFVYELLKFPFLLQKMLQNIAENNPNSNKGVQNNPKIPQKASAKTTSEPHDKRDLPVNNVTNVDKPVSEAASKKQQPSTVNTRRNVPPFLLTFEIFNRNVHNCMVDSGVSYNVMPWSVCQKINAEVQPSILKIIHLDRTTIKVIGELRNVLIRLSSNPNVHQVIDIIVADIPEVYGLFLRRDWLEQLHGDFVTDWSHLWLPENGKPKRIKVNRERYLKFTVTDLNDPNEPFTPSAGSPEIQGMDTFFGNFMDKTSTITNPEQQYEILTYTQPTSSSQWTHATDKNQIWSLYFDGSKSKEGAGAGCVLINPVGNKTLIACRLEFKCTNNTAEYEALLQGLSKALDMNIQNLTVFGDSEIMVR